MVYTKKEQPYKIEKEGEDEVLRLNYENKPYSPSIEDNPLVMMDALDKLIENPSISRITFFQRKNYNYDSNQTSMLMDIANIYNYFVKNKRTMNPEAMGIPTDSPDLLAQRFEVLRQILFYQLKIDPIGAYAELKRVIRGENINLKKSITPDEKESIHRYLSILNKIFESLDRSSLINGARNFLPGYTSQNRDIYKNIFKPSITPDFMYSKIMASPPLDGEQLDIYKIDNKSEVTIYNTPKEIKKLYHITPPEFKISEDKYNLVDMAKSVLSQHQPQENEFLDPEKMRNTFTNIGKDLIRDLADQQGIPLSPEELLELAEILVRHTIGFGVLELILVDDKVQDITINSPPGQSPIFVLHQDHGECVTNIVPSKTDFEGWATKLRLISGRPLDEANPILDTELILPQARSRVSIITKPLNPFGYSLAFRRHRDTPWTLPLFLKVKMISPLGAGLMSFLIDGSRSILVAGTRSSGKTSFLGSLLLEIMRRYRILTIEDTLEIPTEAMRKLGYNIQPLKVRAALVKGGSEVPADEGIRTSLRLGDSALIVGEVRSSIRGNEEVMIVKNNLTQLVQIKDLENQDISNIFVPTMDFDLKFRLKKLKGFIKHPPRKKLLEVTTRTGRKVTVTPDHSLFTHKDFRILPIECKDLKIGSKIILPEKLPSDYNNIQKINLLELLKGRGCRIEGYEEDLKEIIQKIGYKKATEIAKISNDIYQYLRKGIQHTNIPIDTFVSLSKAANHTFSLQKLKLKTGTSKTLNAEIPITKDFCRFLGYYVAEGYTSKSGTIVLSNDNPNIKKDIINLAKNLFNVNCYQRITKSLGVSTQIVISNRIVGHLISALGCGRIALKKRVPSFIYGLSEEKICEFLKGYFDGDGSQTASKNSGNSISASTISKKLASDICYLFLQIGIVARIEEREQTGKGKHKQYRVIFKQRKYIEKFLDKIGFIKYKKEIINRSFSHSKLNSVNYNCKILEDNVKIKRKYRHLRRHSSCGKDYLKKVIDDDKFASDKIKTFVNGDFYLDEVKRIKEIKLDKEEYVYDLSVEPCQNFVGGFGGIMLHNSEAKALYEAMRIGASANVVAGTIHGDSPYGVFDRVVNDLDVPKTSFKATDIIAMCNPIRSGGGLKKVRRVLSITEVRKDWEQDPQAERGFVDLMKYNAKTDLLEPTPDLINGDSEVLKAIGANVREWVGNWDAIWENILLRADIKKMILDYSIKTNQPKMLEAAFCLESNDMQHRISENVVEEVGQLDPKIIKERWENWLKDRLKQ